MGRLRIFAVDPGGTIGYAVMEPPLKLIEADQTTNELYVRERLLALRPTEFVQEGYRLYPGMSRILGFSTMEAVRMAERFKALCDEEGIPVFEQSSAQIGERGLFTPRLLRQLNLWQPGKPHANDAIRHCLYRLWFVHGYNQHEDVADLVREMLAEVIGTDAEQR